MPVTSVHDFMCLCRNSYTLLESLTIQESLNSRIRPGSITLLCNITGTQKPLFETVGQSVTNKQHIRTFRSLSLFLLPSTVSSVQEKVQCRQKNDPGPLLARARTQMSQQSPETWLSFRLWNARVCKWQLLLPICSSNSPLDL